jgi:hypothetical protein
MWKPRAKLAIFYAILVLGVASTLELLAFATYAIVFHERFSYDRPQSERLSLLQSPEAKSDAARSEAPTWILHPYYAYVGNPASRPLPFDKFGFLGNEDQIQGANLNKVVVAVVGGSVAAELASATDFAGIFQAELKMIPAFRDKEIVLLNLGNGAYKQPQGLIVINDLLSRGSHIDILVALDGFNEIAVPEAHGIVSDGTSPFYPFYWRQLVEANASPDKMNALAKLNFASRLRVKLAANFAGPILRHLVTANLIWRVADRQLQGAMLRYRVAIDRQPPASQVVRLTGNQQPSDDHVTRITSNQLGFLGPPIKYRTRRELYLDIAKQWGRASVLMEDIVTAQGGLYFHFLQPNQYVPDSKPFGAEEKRIAVYPLSVYRKPVEIGYPYLRAMGASLRSAGLWFEDLTDIFRGDSEDLYIDSCCHLNGKGIAIVARAIARAIASRLATGEKAKPLALDQANFTDAIFAIQELRKFVPSSPDYDGGSLDPVGGATEVGAPKQ